jgi:hypothetical protein
MLINGGMGGNAADVGLSTDDRFLLLRLCSSMDGSCDKENTVVALDRLLPEDVVESLLHGNRDCMSCSVNVVVLDIGEGEDKTGDTGGEAVKSVTEYIGGYF